VNFIGKIIRFVSRNRKYLIEYEDLDTEEITELHMLQFLTEETYEVDHNFPSQSSEPSSKSSASTNSSLVIQRAPSALAPSTGSTAGSVAQLIPLLPLAAAAASSVPVEQLVSMPSPTSSAVSKAAAVAQLLSPAAAASSVPVEQLVSMPSPVSVGTPVPPISSITSSAPLQITMPSPSPIPKNNLLARRAPGKRGSTK
jgi:hypothetical protein